MVKFLKWGDDMEEWGEIECPMLNNESVMTYCLKGEPCYYSYTAPFANESGEIGYYRYDHDEGYWDEDTFFCLGNN